MYSYYNKNPRGKNVGDCTVRAISKATGKEWGETYLAMAVQGYLEGSNVQVATEMVNLIVAQRAYEMNSKAITTTDEMMQTANNLKR